MQPLFLHRIPKGRQFALAALVVCLVAGVCYAASGLMSYRVVAFILLVTVSLTAMLFDILPVLLAALLSALIWDFFFIPPRFTLQVGATEDAILLLMYFVIAMVNAVLTYKIRQAEKESLEKEERAHALKLYNTLLNSLSHELRTPIAAIIGATDNLQQSNSGLTPQNRAELIGEIATASLRLNRQVDNLLNMSRLESGYAQPKADWCDVSEVVYEAVRQAEGRRRGPAYFHRHQSCPATFPAGCRYAGADCRQPAEQCGTLYGRERQHRNQRRGSCRCAGADC